MAGRNWLLGPAAAVVTIMLRAQHNSVSCLQVVSYELPHRGRPNNRRDMASHCVLPAFIPPFMMVTQFVVSGITQRC